MDNQHKQPPPALTYAETIATKTIPGNVSCTRDSNDEFTITITDKASRASVEVTLTASQFSLLITGVEQSKVPVTYRPLPMAHWGMKFFAEQREVLLPEGLDRGTWNFSYGESPVEQWVYNNCQEPGLYVDPALRSQNSFKAVQDGVMARYNVYGWKKDAP